LSTKEGKVERGLPKRGALQKKQKTKRKEKDDWGRSWGRDSGGGGGGGGGGGWQKTDSKMENEKGRSQTQKLKPNSKGLKNHSEKPWALWKRRGPAKRGTKTPKRPSETEGHKRQHR